MLPKYKYHIKSYLRLVKLPLLIFFLLLSSTYLYSQDWQLPYNQSSEHYETQTYDSALLYIEEAILLIEKENSIIDSVYLDMLNNLGQINFALKNYQEAIDAYLKSNTYIDETTDKDFRYIVNCENIAEIYQLLQEYNKAEKYLTEAQSLIEDIFGKNDLHYANNSILLADLYGIMRKLGDAEILYNTARDIIANKLTREHPQYVNISSKLAVFYKRRRNYKKSEALFLECLSIRENILGEENILYANDCENLALLYNKIGKYTDAELVILKCISIREELLGKQHSDYVDALYYLALIYKNSGQYVEAEPFYIKVKDFKEKQYGKTKEEYAEACNNLALVYSDMGNYDAAKPLLIEAKNIREDIYGKQSLKYSKSCNNIAAVYVKTEEYKLAESLLIESKDIKESIVGKKSTSYANSCNNLAYLYSKTGKINEAERLYKQAIKINEKKYGKSHLNYIKACNNLGNLYIDNGNYNKAEELLIEIKSIAIKKIGLTHPYYAEICNNLAKLYRLRNQLSLAKPVFLESIEAVNGIIKQNFGLLSEKEKEMFFNKFQKNFEEFNAYALLAKDNDSLITSYVYNNALNNKGMLLKSSTAMRYAILKSNDSELIKKYDYWIELKIQISGLYSLPIYERGDNLKNLESTANSIEKELIAGSQMFANSEKEKSITWEDVQSSLEPNEAAIEFINFNFTKDSCFYCALVVTPESKYPEMIKLFEEKQLDDIFGKFKMNNLKYINSLYGKKSQGNSNLYNLIWKPIEPFLSNSNKLYISPSGLLHKISFSALCKEKDVFLCDLYNINLKSSTSKLLFPSQDNFENLSAMIIGGVQYSSDTTESNIWTYLPGTKEETDSIITIFNNNDVQFTYNSDMLASESYFKNTSVDYNILHISTHGYFYPSPKGRIYSSKNDADTDSKECRASANGDWGFGQYAFTLNKQALMRSGLVLAGANNVWNRGSFPQPLIEDGVLTAQEVSLLNLIDVKLTVMSACETGLGEIRGSEGVYGLQRSFKMAGVDFIVMSLWKVADEETKEFMTSFYTNLLREKNAKKAFNITQHEMRNKYDPYFWGAFVLVE